MPRMSFGRAITWLAAQEPELARRLDAVIVITSTWRKTMPYKNLLHALDKGGDTTFWIAEKFAQYLGVSPFGL